MASLQKPMVKICFEGPDKSHFVFSNHPGPHRFPGTVGLFHQHLVFVPYGPELDYYILVLLNYY